MDPTLPDNRDPSPATVERARAVLVDRAIRRSIDRALDPGLAGWIDQHSEIELVSGRPGAAWN
jgi:hypothetical protein